MPLIFFPTVPSLPKLLYLYEIFYVFNVLKHILNNCSSLLNIVVYTHRHLICKLFSEYILYWDLPNTKKMRFSSMKEYLSQMNASL